MLLYVVGFLFSQVRPSARVIEVNVCVCDSISLSLSLSLFLFLSLFLSSPPSYDQPPPFDTRQVILGQDMGFCQQPPFTGKFHHYSSYSSLKEEREREREKGRERNHLLSAVGYEPLCMKKGISSIRDDHVDHRITVLCTNGVNY